MDGFVRRKKRTLLGRIIERISPKRATRRETDVSANVIPGGPDADAVKARREELRSAGYDVFEDIVIGECDSEEFL